MAAVDDLRLALTNMAEKAEETELDGARKNLRRCREIAIKLTRVNGDLGRRIIEIITDAQGLVHKSPSISNYLRYVAHECLLTIDSPITQDVSDGDNGQDPSELA